MPISSSSSTGVYGRVHVCRHHSAEGWWELAFALPPPSLRAHVRRYCGWREHTATPLCRFEPASTDVPVIVLFGAPVRVYESVERARWREVGSFVAGVSDRCAYVGSAGVMAGVQIDFTTIGARRFLGQPLAAFTNAIVEINDLWGADGARLTDQLAEACTWDARFDLLDEVIATRVAGSTPLHAGLEWAARRLAASAGQLRVAEMATAVGWSHKHFARRFEHELGLAPKTMARVLRFDTAMHALRSGNSVRLSEVAARCGYYDQAHFSRDFRQFAGITPRELLAARLPDNGGFAFAD